VAPGLRVVATYQELFTMKDQANWYIAVKEIEPISGDLREKLVARGVEVVVGRVFIHAHIFIPHKAFARSEEIFKAGGFKLTQEHPPVCSVGSRPGFEIYEKRVPIIESREARFLAEMVEEGVMMSGGAGKPHIHLSIPGDKREEVLRLLDENAYYPKETSG